MHAGDNAIVLTMPAGNSDVELCGSQAKSSSNFSAVAILSNNSMLHADRITKAQASMTRRRNEAKFSGDRGMSGRSVRPFRARSPARTAKWRRPESRKARHRRRMNRAAFP